MLAIIGAVMALAAGASQAAVEPFGLKFGAPISTTKPVRHTPNGTWVVKPPKPSSLFTSYHVTATPQTGICSVTAFAQPKNDPLEMTATYAVYDAALEALTQRYGEPGLKVEPRKSKGGDSTSLGYPLDEPDLPFATWALKPSEVSVMLVTYDPKMIMLTYSSSDYSRCLEITDKQKKAKAAQGL